MTVRYEFHRADDNVTDDIKTEATYTLHPSGPQAGPGYWQQDAS